jgi:nitric oxide synthase oxygenase domain/subunit
MGYEADACAEAILIDKKQECETMGWEESQAIMDVMSEIIQRCGLKYPGSIVSHEGPGSLD